MKIQDFYYRLYAPLTRQGRLYSLLRYVIRNVANRHLRIRFAHKSRLSEIVAENTIVSLTTFPARIDYVWMAIESIIRQQVRPEKIILWLSAEQFDNVDSLPNHLIEQQEQGLEIRIVQGDARSHKKYIYAFKEYPNKRIILIDDDIIFRSDFVKNVVTAYENSNAEKRIVCCYAMHMQYDKNETLFPYKRWEKEYGESCDSSLFFGSGGGIIGMAKDFYSDLTNIDLALRLTPTADDIWLNTMAKLAGTRVYKIGRGLFMPVIIPDNKELYTDNVGGSSNDKQIHCILEYYQINKL